MRLHFVGLPHTVTRKDYCACAYTQKVLNACKMMHARGHDVIHYGAEGAEVPCSTVNLVSAAELEFAFGPESERIKNPAMIATFEESKPYWRAFNSRAALAIKKWVRRGDFLCLIGGTAQKPIADEVGEGDCITVEYGIGYYGYFAKYKVFESYTHQAACYAMRSADPEASLYDAVIPNYFDPADFPTGAGGNYLLFIGRLIPRKGIQIAIETARAAGMRLVVAGAGDTSLLTPECEYVGPVGVQRRGELMAGARAVLAPTTYMEPFGGTAVEAQLCGTPVITTDHAAFSETVVQGVTGFRCHTLAEFAQAVEDVAGLDRAAIRERAIGKYSMDVIALEYEKHFARLAGLWGEGWSALPAGLRAA